MARAPIVPTRRCRYGIIGRVADRGTQDRACTVADEAYPLLPQRRPQGEPLTELDADPPRVLPDLDVLRQVLACLRRLD
jgi:hypothetical protein